MIGLGPDVVAVAGPIRVELFDFFYSSTQLYRLSSPYPRFIPSLYRFVITTR